MYQLNAYKKTQKLKFEIHLTDHCNLNCVGCNHFSPLADSFYLDITAYKQDCKRIWELTEGNVQEIVLLGGEPLLHPNLKEIFSISSKYFPKRINGIPCFFIYFIFSTEFLDG